MDCETKKVGATLAVVMCVHFALGERTAQAQTCSTSLFPNTNECGQFDTHAIAPNTSFLLENNAWGDNGQCIDWNSAGGFCLSKSPGSFFGYPNLLQGQVFDNGPTTNSGLPLQVSQIQSWPVSWSISGTNASGTWDAPIEFWAQTYQPGTCGEGNSCNTNADCSCGVKCDVVNASTGQKQCGFQPDGTELLVWLAADRNDSNLGGQPDTPGGVGGLPIVGSVTIGGIQWDVYAGRWPANQNPPPATFWNYVAYYPAQNLTAISTDFKAFFDDARIRTGVGFTEPLGPCQDSTNGTIPNVCLDPSWWVRSVQAGFENDSGGVGLSSNCFASAANAPAPPAYRDWIGVNPIPTASTSMGSGWAIGSDSKGTNGDFGIYQFLGSPDFAKGHWNEVSGGAVTVSVDLNKNPWIVNNAGQIYQWNGSSWTAFGPSSFKASSVASGSSVSETWAIQKSDQTIFHWTGTNATNGSWAQVPGFPAGNPPPQGSKIAVFSAPDTSCGGSAPPHSPVVLGLNENIYFYQCGQGAFTFANGAGTDISTDLAVGGDGNLYVWRGCGEGWGLYNAAPFGTNTRIGGWADGIFAMPVGGTISPSVVAPNCAYTHNCP